MKTLLTLFVLFFSSSVVADDINGSAWIFYEDDGDKSVILFEEDGTFTYLNVIANSGNEGRVFSETNDTWSQSGDEIVISFNDGYMLVSLKINKNGDKMSGTAINKKGKIQKIEGRLIK